jgi:hypothetical protein
VLPLAVPWPRVAPLVPAWRAPPVPPGEPTPTHTPVGGPLGATCEGEGRCTRSKDSTAVRVRVATCAARPHARGTLGDLTWRTPFPPVTRTPLPTLGRTPTNTLVDHTSRWSPLQLLFCQAPLDRGPLVAGSRALGWGGATGGTHRHSGTPGEVLGTPVGQPRERGLLKGGSCAAVGPTRAKGGAARSRLARNPAQPGRPTTTTPLLTGGYGSPGSSPSRVFLT